MLPTVNNPAILELEDDAAANIEVLAVPEWSSLGPTFDLVSRRDDRVA